MMKKYQPTGNEVENVGKSNNLFKKMTCDARKLVLQIKETPNIEECPFVSCASSHNYLCLSSGFEKRLTYWSIQRGN